MVDEFYTKYPERFKDVIMKYITDDDVLIEPSCGDGAFLKLFDFDAAYDIVEKVKSPIFEQKDFLETNLDNDIPTQCVFIGNPPFGKNSKLAIDFCKHCCELDAKYIMFILPIVFKNKSYQNKSFEKHYHLIESIDYNEFVRNGQDVKVECVFQVWQKRNDERIETKSSSIKPKYFAYIPHSKVTQELSNDERIYSIRRVGSTTPQLT